MKKILFLILLLPVLHAMSFKMSAQNRKIVLLKLDDVHYGENGEAIPERWQRVTDYIEKKGIKAGFGIIGYSLAEDNPAYFKWIKDIAEQGNIEFWNHGYWNRTAADTIGEFERNYEEQFRALFLTDSLAKANLNLELHVWGPHWSSTNEDTDRALSNMPGIRMTLGSPQNPRFYTGYVFHSNLQMEYPVHNPDFDSFVEAYNGEWKNLDFFYLQGHPNSWDDTRWNHFVRIIDFLESENVLFVTPGEFLKIMISE